MDPIEPPPSPDAISFPPPAQVTALVSAPAYPNAVKWSDENLLAVCSGHLAYVLNPASLPGPRCFVPVVPSPGFDIGKIQGQDILAPSVQGLTLVKDTRPCVRSLAWSPQGFASNGGCLLAVCTTDHRVKFYRSPYFEFQSEWVEVFDVSEVIYAHLLNNNFEKTESAALALGLEDEALAPSAPSVTTRKRKLPAETDQSKKKKKLSKQGALDIADVESNKLNPGPLELTVTIVPSITTPRKYVTAAQYATRSAELAHLVVAWSPQCTAQSVRDRMDPVRHFSVFAVGGKSGRILFFRVPKPLSYSVGKPLPLLGIDFVGSTAGHKSWITALEWVMIPDNVRSSGILLLASGSSDGSVKLWIANSQSIGNFCPPSTNSPFKLLKQVMDVDLVPVTTLAMVHPSQGGYKVLLAIGKGSGSVAALECYTSGDHGEKAYELRAHDQLVTGLTWTLDGRILYTCGQDNSLRIWEFSRNRLSSLAFPRGSSLLATDTTRISEELPAAVLESFFGVALSPGNIALVVLRGVSADMVDQMYQARSQKGVVQLFWIGGQRTQEDISATDEHDLVLWTSRIVAALTHMEYRESPLVLWDIIAATSLIAQWTSSIQPVESILSSWLLNQDSILLMGIKPEVLSGRCSIQEVVNPHERRNAEQDEHLGDRSSKIQLWRGHLNEVEQELRQRLVFLTLFATASRRQDLDDDEERTSSESSLQTAVLTAWAGRSDSKSFPELMQVAASLRKAGDVCASSVSETCNLCKARVPFESLEVAYCQRGEGKGPNHKLQRCAVSLRICPPTPLWYCRGCGRWVANLPPLLFFSMSSRMQVMQIPMPLLVQDRICPSCAFCGILMQRLLPDFLQAPSPV